MAQVFDIRRQIGSNDGVSINVDQVDNEVFIALNGTEIADLTGLSGFTRSMKI